MNGYVWVWDSLARSRHLNCLHNSVTFGLMTYRQYKDISCELSCKVVQLVWDGRVFWY